MNKIFGVFLLMIIGFIANSQVKMQKQTGGFLFTENNENIFFYQVEPKNYEGKYQRCNYIHPLWGIDGTVLTEDFPSDHFHHRGIFWAWHQVWIGDKQISDGWEIKDFEQVVTDIEYISDKSGYAVFKTGVDWKSPLWREDGKMMPYLKENTKITIHSKSGNYRKIDFEIKLLALVENLKIGGSADEKGYSGFSARLKLPESIIFKGPEGEITAENTAVKSKGYINVSNLVTENNKTAGVVIVDNPENPGYPQPWILRNKNSMQNAAYPGNILIPVSAQNPVTLKYSLIVYTGKISHNKIQKIIE